MIAGRVLQLFQRLPLDYQDLLQSFFNDPQHWQALQTLTLAEEQARQSEPVYPPANQVFAALFQTPVAQVKVVLIGQDPYHTPGLAHGLAFSIPEQIDTHSRAYPSSLRNISKALFLEGYQPLSNGFLLHWAQQGVLLLNTILTVPAGKPQGHQTLQWQILTNALIAALAKHHQDLVWLLWGKSAQKKIPLIASHHQHCILTASHPSGLGVYQTDEPFLLKGDQGSCGHFRKTNDWLIAHHKKPIQWTDKRKDLWSSS
jgi:uracil-DNA glycosylase